jgi:hypothetical protein
LNREDTRKILASLGIKECGPDHPIYKGGTTIRFVNRSGTTGSGQQKNGSVTSLQKKSTGIFQAVIAEFIEDLVFDIDWDYERRIALERLARQRAGLAAQPTASLLQFPKEQVISDGRCHSENGSFGQRKPT